jgi:hypothetical protein
MDAVHSNMAEFSHALTMLVADASGAFREMGAADWRRTRGDGQWTRLEILGHLIDSAANNHQRFVRAMAHGDLVWPGYDAAAMVAVQQFGTAAPALLIGLWESFNLYLARLIALIPENRLAALCTIGGEGELTLELLVVDYVRHMQHHLRQILADAAPDIRWVETP